MKRKKCQTGGSIADSLVTSPVDNLYVANRPFYPLATDSIAAGEAYLKGLEILRASTGYSNSAVKDIAKMSYGLNPEAGSGKVKSKIPRFREKQYGGKLEYQMGGAIRRFPNIEWNPKNWGVKDYSNNKDFGTAYASARKAGESEFMFNGKRYSTKYKGTPQEQLKATGITDTQIGASEVLRETVYKNTTPYTSMLPSLVQGAKSLFTQDANRDINVENPFPITYFLDSTANHNTFFKDLPVEEQAKYKESSKPYFRRAEDAWALYTSNPQRFNTFSVSNYRPSVEKSKDVPYYYSVTSSYPELKDFVLNEGRKLKEGESKVVTEPTRLLLRDFKIGRGRDDKGEYISYYDKWNLNPSLEFPIPEQGKPFEIYDRIYLDNDTTTSLPKKQYGGDLVSTLGYRDDSPFKNAPQLNINSPSISMENVSTPLIGISNQTGEIKHMKPNKKYKFKNTSSVTEMPAYQTGGKIVYSKDDPELIKYQKALKDRERKRASNEQMKKQELEEYRAGYVKRLTDPEYQGRVSVEEAQKQYDKRWRKGQEEDIEEAYNKWIAGKSPMGFGMIKTKRGQYMYIGQGYDDPKYVKHVWDQPGYEWLGPEPSPVVLGMKPLDKLPSKLTEVSSMATTPKIHSQYNVQENGTLAPITKKGYDRLMQGELLKEYKTGKVLPKQDIIMPKYAAGGFLDSLLKMGQTVGSFAGPVGMGISAASTLLPLVKNLFAKPDDTVVSGSPGAYASGGDIHINPKNKGKFTAAAKKAGHSVQEHARAVLNDPNATPLQKKRANFARNAAKWHHQSGGDIESNNDDTQLSATAFQVNGNPNVVDGNKYNYGGTPIALDHNEVVDNGFVYSEDLPSPYDKSFADIAAAQTKAAGEMQKRLKRYPGDTIAAKTAKYTTANLSQLKQVHETVATNLGLRNNAQSYQTSGPVYMSVDPNNPDIYYDPYNKSFLHRNFQTGAYSPYANAPLQWTPSQEAINAHLERYPLTTSKPSKPTGTSRDAFFKQYPGAKPYGDFPAPVDPTINPLNFLPLEELPRFRSDRPTPLADPLDKVSSMQEPVGPDLDSLTKAVSNFTPGPIEDSEADNSYRTPFTVGDVFQGVNVLSKFIQGFQRSEVEPAQTIGTPITQESYDPTSQLYSNQLQYRTAVNRYSDNPNMRRAVASQLLGTKLRADDEVNSKYNAMNKGARTQFEERLARRRAANIASSQYTNDINARNRAARRAGIDNAFNSLSNFGMALNAKSQANDVVNMFSKMYPDVSKNVISGLTQEDLLKILLRNGQ